MRQQTLPTFLQPLWKEKTIEDQEKTKQKKNPGRC
jgi:hypothetical protein